MPSTVVIVVIAIIVLLVLLLIIGFVIWKLTQSTYYIIQGDLCVAGANVAGSFKDDPRCGFKAGDKAYDFDSKGVCTLLTATGAVSQYKNDPTCGKNTLPDTGNFTPLGTPLPVGNFTPLGSLPTGIFSPLRPIPGNNVPQIAQVRPLPAQVNNDKFCGHPQQLPNKNGYNFSILSRNLGDLYFRSQLAQSQGKKFTVNFLKVKSNLLIAVRTSVTGQDGDVSASGNLCNDICVRLVGNTKDFNSFWNVYPGSSSGNVVFESATRPGYFLGYNQDRVLTANWNKKTEFQVNYQSNTEVNILSGDLILRGQLDNTLQCGTVQTILPGTNEGDRFIITLNEAK